MANGQPPSRGNGKAGSRPSVRQLKHVRELAGRVGLDAEQSEGLCQRLCATPLAELCGDDASGLIRAVQKMREGWLRRVTASRKPLNGSREPVSCRHASWPAR